MSERRHPTSKPVPDAKDHKGWIAHWYSELSYALAKYDADAADKIALEHLVRSARMLHWHVLKWRPGLKPPKDY